MAATAHQIKTWSKVGTLTVFSLLCLIVQIALVILLFMGGTFNDILPWTVTIITVYFGVIKMLIPTANSQTNNPEQPYFTPTPSPELYANPPHTPSRTEGV